jgi:rhodanese-related sulfurtransferase
VKKLLFLVVAVAAMLLAACGPKPAAAQTVAVEGGSYTNVSAVELQQMLKVHDFVFVNVHIPFAGNIAGTDASIPYDEISQKLSLLPPDKSYKIVLYCRSGHMSKLAAETLVKLGYTNVWQLDGGMQAWEAAGLPLESK